MGVVGLSSRMGHKPYELSGGEQQRVAIASALANDPPVILADEPTGELDSVNAKMVTEFLVKVNQEFGKTILMVTHDAAVARAADRILKIEDGVITAQMEPTQLVDEDVSVSYGDTLRARIANIDAQLVKLDAAFRSSVIDGDAYVEERVRLNRAILKNKYHYLPVDGCKHPPLTPSVAIAR